MCVKGRLTLFVQRLHYHMKSIGLLRIIPLLIMNVLVPLLNAASYQKNGADEQFVANVLDLAQLFFPFFSVWYVVFVLREYIETDGNELLFVSGRRAKLADMCGLFLCSLANVAALFLIYSFLAPELGAAFIGILCTCIWYFGIAYGVTFLTGSTTVTLLVLLIYTLFNFVTLRDQVYFPLYYTTQPMSLALFLRLYLPLAAGGVAFAGIGVWANRRKRKFV